MLVHISRCYCMFHNALFINADPRTKNWFLLSGTPIYVWMLTASYLLFVWLGPKYMRHRKPYSLTAFMIVYNLGCVLLSCYMLWEVGMTVTRILILSILSSALSHCLVLLFALPLYPSVSPLPPCLQQILYPLFLCCLHVCIIVMLNPPRYVNEKRLYCSWFLVQWMPATTTSAVPSTMPRR